LFQVTLEKTLKQYQHIIWDWNGTLLDDVDCCYNTIVELMERYGLGAISREEYLRKFRFPVTDYYRDIGFNLEVHSMEIIAQEWFAIYNKYRKDCQLFTGMKELITHLNEANISSYILTAAHEKDVHQLLQDYGIFPLFRYIYGLDNHQAVSKVARGRELLKHLPCSQNQIVMVGDTDHDAEVALEIGIDAILLSGGHQEGRCYKSVAQKFQERGKRLILLPRL
jgi:phosphoglycolate phosphatase